MSYSNSNSDSDSDDFQSLSDQYNSTLSQYKQMYQNYIQSLKTNDQSGNLVTISDASFWGTSGINSTQESSLNDCVNSCSANSSCTGATYNNSNQNCYLRKGNGNVITSKSGETAIVSQSLQYSYQLKDLNQQLLDTNKKMTDSLNQSYNSYQKNSYHHQKKNELLQNNNNVLENDKLTIHEMIQEHELLNAADQNSQIVVTQEYAQYIVYLLVVILLIALLLKFSFSSNSQLGGGLGKSFLKKFM